MAAQDAARRVRGVRAVANEIEVRLPGAAERGDMEIAAAVARALEWDAAVQVDTIDATVSRGWVTLQGEVAWQYQRQAAERVVRRAARACGSGMEQMEDDHVHNNSTGEDQRDHAR
jgi:osmotically-inducible protein OsmY